MGTHHTRVDIVVTGNRLGDGKRIGSGQGDSQRLQSLAQLRRVVSFGRIGGGGPHQYVVQGTEGPVLGQQGAHPGHQRGHRGVADECRLTGDRFVEDEGQGVDIGLAVEDPTFDLFGGRVAGRTQDGPVGLGPRRLGQGAGQPEVGDAQPAIGVEEEIGRLDVTMDHAPSVGVLEPGGDLDAHLDRLFGSEERPGVEHLPQTAAGQVLEDQIGLIVLFAPVVDLEDVGVVEGCRRPSLGPETLEEGGIAGQGRMEDLDGHPAMQGDVVGQIDVRGRTGPQGSDESVAAAEDTPDGVGDTRHDYSGSDYRSHAGNRWRVELARTSEVTIPVPDGCDSAVSDRLHEGSDARQEPVRAREGGADLVVARRKQPHRDRGPPAGDGRLSGAARRA